MPNEQNPNPVCIRCGDIVATSQGAVYLVEDHNSRVLFLRKLPELYTVQWPRVPANESRLALLVRRDSEMESGLYNPPPPAW